MATFLAPWDVFGDIKLLKGVIAGGAIFLVRRAVALKCITPYILARQGFYGKKSWL